MTALRSLATLSTLLIIGAATGCKPFAFARVFQFSTASSYVEAAEELSRQGETEAAIEQYRQHIAYRLDVKDRPTWENPYFYLLLIGDLQLNAGQPSAALGTYEEAERQKVHTSLVSDRYRSVARWYEEQGKLAEAVTVLQQYRSRDELLFDSMLDRISKQIVRIEEAADAPRPAVPLSPAPEGEQHPTPPAASLPQEDPAAQPTAAPDEIAGRS